MSNFSLFTGAGESPRAVNIAQGFIGEILGPGDIAVDATAGNGNDTLFLARAVGQAGKVYSFDIQKDALRKTYARLLDAGLAERVCLLDMGHEHMEEFIPADSCRGIMFNLGYLPGSNKNVKTAPHTTLQGIEQALKLLLPGGRLSLVVYRGHPGAVEEAKAVDEIISSLEACLYWTARITFPNKDARSPYVILVKKKAGA